MIKVNKKVSKSLVEKSESFLLYLHEWQAGLGRVSLKDIISEPQRAAILSVDMIEGFCRVGPLSSPRVAGIISPIVNLFRAAWKLGLRNIILVQDTHDEHAEEFNSWPEHCVRGTPEAETVLEFKELPFFDQILTTEKNSISSELSTGFKQWIASHPQVNTFIVVGNCTDLCTYQLAMYLRLEANEQQLHRRVIVPANCVQTYDIPVETAKVLGVVPHDGDLLHEVFLYHMRLNGIEVVREIK